MASGSGTGPDPLGHLARLRDQPEKHHIFLALRMIEAAYPDRPRIGEARRPKDEVVRFGQEPELSFPPSTVSSFKPPKGRRPGKLTNRFFGLFGPHGPLPLHLTEYARDRVRNHRDPTMVAFADMLTHRMMTLLYRAWRQGQPAPGFDRGDFDSFEKKVAAVAGYAGHHAQAVDDLPDVAKRHFAGLFAQGPKNAEGLQTMLEAFYGTKVKVIQFVGTWLDLEPSDQWQMGQPAALGQTTSVGERVWSRQAKFRLRIGPLSLADYERLLPGGASLPRLRDLVRNYVGDALDWDVNLVLRQEDAPPAKLGETVRLGQTGWIGEIKTDGDLDDLYLEPNAVTQNEAQAA